MSYGHKFFDESFNRLIDDSMKLEEVGSDLFCDFYSKKQKGMNRVPELNFMHNPPSAPSLDEYSSLAESLMPRQRVNIHANIGLNVLPSEPVFPIKQISLSPIQKPKVDLKTKLEGYLSKDREAQLEEKLCSICTVNSCNIRLDCGHQACATCTLDFVNKQNKKCPYCRETFNDVLLLF